MLHHQHQWYVSTVAMPVPTAPKLGRMATSLETD
jgi:hypothetical protein